MRTRGSASGLVVVLLLVLLVAGGMGAMLAGRQDSPRGGKAVAARPGESALRLEEVARRGGLARWHDDSLRVTCWSGAGTYCLPDAEVGR